MSGMRCRLSGEQKGKIALGALRSDLTVSSKCIATVVGPVEVRRAASASTPAAANVASFPEIRRSGATGVLRPWFVARRDGTITDGDAARSLG